MKKLLSIVLALALCLTAMMGCFAVSAESTNTIVVDTVEIDEGTATAVVPVSIKSAGIYAAQITLSYAEGLEIVDIASEGADKVEANEAKTNVIVELAADTTDVNLTLTFNTANLAVADAVYAVSVTAIDAGNYSEQAIADFTITNGGVKVNAVAVEPAEPIYDPDNVVIGGKNASFEAAYSLIYYVKESVFKAYDEFTIDVEMEQYDGNTLIAPRIVTLTEDNIRLNEDGTPSFYVYKNENYYIFLLDGISAKEVANKIIATPKAVKDGVSYYGATHDYNLVTYAAKNTGKTTAFAKAMFAFLNYAAAAQERFGYNTNNLANASLTEAEKVVTLGSELQDDKTAIPEGYSGDVTVYGFNVSYQAQVQMVVYLKFANNFDFAGKQLKFVYTDAFNKTVTDYIDLTNIDEYYSSTILTVRYSGIAAKDMRTIVTMVVVDSEGNEISNTRDYSFTSYAFSKASSTDGPVSKAMIAFADALYAYKNN